MIAVDPATACHEAGHAVIARVLGCMPVSVTAVEDHDSGGHCIIPDPWAIEAAWDARGKWREHDSILRCRIVAFMAGREAEEEIVGSSCGDADGEDAYQIACMMDYLGASIDQETRMRGICRNMVRRYRASIERVAGALLKGATLSGDDVRRLISDAPGVRSRKAGE